MILGILFKQDNTLQSCLLTIWSSYHHRLFNLSRVLTKQKLFLFKVSYAMQQDDLLLLLIHLNLIQ